MIENWRQHGACAEVDPDLWFPDLGSSSAAAKAVCLSCEVRTQCLDHALKHGELGIWGGTTENQRRAIRRAQDTRRPAPASTPEEPRRNAAKCGTPAGYKRHRRNGEEACPACLRAKADAIARYRQTGTTKEAA